MVKIRSEEDKKNLIGKRLLVLRLKHDMSQRDLAAKLQLAGYNLDRNVITRIETYKRFVSDIELKGLCEIFNISSDELLEIKTSDDLDKK